MKRRKRTRKQRAATRCFKLVDVRFDCYVVVLWNFRCKVTMEARA